MTLQIDFKNAPPAGADTALFFVSSDKKLGPDAARLDKAAKSHICGVLAKTARFSGKQGEIFILALPHAKIGHVMLIGTGDAKKLTALDFETLGGKAFMSAESVQAKNLAVHFDAGSVMAAHFAAGMKLRSYKFEIYKTLPKDKKKPFSQITIVTSKSADAAKTYKRLRAPIEGVFTARDMVNDPPNKKFPPDLANRIAKELKPLGVQVEILDEKKMKTLGMGGILGVGMGSAYPPRMVIMRWNVSKGKKPLALIGKGVTFDTGGVSIKPAQGMEEMKMDMAGAAAVIGTMKSLAIRKSKASVVGIVGIAENMLSERAYRPSDILTSYSGKTIEVLNTDAEGRLVLADALSYVQDKYKPRAIIDLATLTGAMMVALGHEYCGTFSTDDNLWNNLDTASKQRGEKLWRMPLDEVWKKEMEGSITDVQNIAKGGRNAGACTAAGFLQHFIEGNTPWAHMDIAGTAWIKSDRATVPRGGTGFAVRTLDTLIENAYEKK
ncbi:MAG: leucyl aminopeptidase [Alphaproteobacteria bacterium]